MSKLKELEKRRDDAIAGIECILKRKKIEAMFGGTRLINITMYKEVGKSTNLNFADWRQVNKLTALMTELLESADG